MNRKKLTPQEKKLLSYLKDTRNSFAESRSKSRFAIAKKRAYGHQSFRHEQNIILNKLIEAPDEEIEILESEMQAIKPKKWRKFNDRPLGEFVSILLRVRAKSGINQGIKTSRTLQLVKSKSKIIWRTGGRWDW